MKKLSQTELDDILNAHEQWWDSRNEAHRAIWQNATDEQKNQTNTDWAEKKLKEYKLRGTQIQILRDLDLRGLSFAGRNLSQLKFENLDLSGANLRETWFARAEMKRINFHKADLCESSFENGVLENINFAEAMMQDTQIDGLIASKNLIFDNAQMSRAFFVKSGISDSSFKNAVLCEASFRRAHLKNCSMENADLREADFTYVYLIDVNIRGANTEGADFSDAKELPEEWKNKIKGSV